MSEFDHNLHEDIAAGEAWLGGMKTPPPSAEAMTRFKAAVRSELSATPSRRGWRLKHWHGALAAAAMIMLAVTIGWESYERYEGGSEVEDQVAMVEAYTYVGMFAAQDESDSTPSVYEEIEDIAEDADDLGDWSLTGNGLFAAIEDSGSGEAEDATYESGALRPPLLEDEAFEGVV